jgi:phospholipid/cholesterol/gamma-HCH transport system ATP-binding protein
MASRPELILFDDPTTGLDPIIASSIDDEIIKLRDLEHVTSIVVTHQIRDAHYIATHEAERTAGGVRITDVGDGKPELADFLVLNNGNIMFRGSVRELLSYDDKYVQEFLAQTLPPW